MKYVPSLPPPVTGVETGLEVKAVAAAKRVKPVQARTLPPLAVQPHARHEALSEGTVKEEKRHDPHFPGGRRTYCRRVGQQSLLIELRSAVERRRNNQRADDITEHVDVKV